MSAAAPTFTPITSPANCPIYVEATPASDKPILFLIHGFMMSGAIWLDNVNALSQHFRCIRIELLGHGRAGAPDNPSAYEMASYVEAIDEVRRQVGAPVCRFCAHSFGAGIALSYGLSFPQFTKAIVFTNSRSALGTLKRKQGALEQMTDALRAQGRAALRAFPAHPKHMKEIQPDVHAALLADAEMLDPIGIANSMAITAKDSNMFDRLAQLEPRALLINGRRERGFQPAREQLQVQHPHLNILDMDAGHSVNAECPDAFNRAAIEFLLGHPD